jgi:hypothetical protein
LEQSTCAGASLRYSLPLLLSYCISRSTRELDRSLQEVDFLGSKHLQPQRQSQVNDTGVPLKFLETKWSISAATKLVVNVHTHVITCTKPCCIGCYLQKRFASPPNSSHLPHRTRLPFLRHTKPCLEKNEKKTGEKNEGKKRKKKRTVAYWLDRNTT